MRTARAVVIDEDPKEALPLLQALGQLGWSTVYVAGDDEALLPTEPISGIRLVFLDLKLINFDEPTQYLPHTVKVLERTVKMTPGVTGIICWTTHDDEIPLLEAELAKRGIEPAFMEAIPNKRTVTNSGTKGIQQVIDLLTAKATALPARALLMEWEQMLHDGATAASDGLYHLGEHDPGLLKILSCVASAAAEERIENSKSALDALFDGLSAVHIDALENFSPSETLNPIGDTLYQAVRDNRKRDCLLKREQG